MEAQENGGSVEGFGPGFAVALDGGVDQGVSGELSGVGEGDLHFEFARELGHRSRAWIMEQSRQSQYDGRSSRDFGRIRVPDHGKGGAVDLCHRFLGLEDECERGDRSSEAGSNAPSGIPAVPPASVDPITLMVGS